MYKFFYCIIFFILLFASVIFTGCAKEYSFEGSADTDSLPSVIIDTTPVIDSIAKDTIAFPYCDACRSMHQPQLSTWSFYYDTSFLCGTITGAVLAFERNAFTFFGPSACSNDTGLVMTVYLGSNVLDNDKFNITANTVIFEYYDNTSPKDIFLTELPINFSLTIDSYEYGTGICKGHFSGYANTKDSSLAEIKSGTFEIQF